MKILVAIESSHFKHAGLEVLLSRVWPAGSHVRLISVIDDFDQLAHFLTLDPAKTMWLEERHDKARVWNYLSQLADQAAERLPGLVVDFAISVGYPKETIIQYAANWSADLVIVGSHERSSIKSLVLESTATTIVQHAHCPVIVARDSFDVPETDSLATNVLVPLDHSPYSAAAIEWLFHQRWKKPAHIRLVTVLNPSTHEFANEPDPERAAVLLADLQQFKLSALRELEALAMHLEQQAGSNYITCEIIEGDPKHALLDLAHHWPAELIIMGSHGHTGLKKFLLGSVSQAIASHSQCSVEIVHLHEVPGVQAFHSALSNEYKTSDSNIDPDRKPHVGFM